MVDDTSQPLSKKAHFILGAAVVAVTIGLVAIAQGYLYERTFDYQVDEATKYIELARVEGARATQALYALEQIQNRQKEYAIQALKHREKACFMATKSQSIAFKCGDDDNTIF